MLNTQLWNIHKSFNSGRSIGPATLECPSVLQMWNVNPSLNSGMSICPATQECPSVRRLWSVPQSRNSGISFSHPSILHLWNVCPFCNSGISVATFEFLSVCNVLNVKARCINVPLAVLVKILPIFSMQRNILERTEKYPYLSQSSLYNDIDNTLSR